MKLLAKHIKEFQNTIQNHYRRRKRNFPWRSTSNPYAILVSEVMLQQTQANRVTPFFGAFLKKFPTPQKLAQAPVGDVLKAWQGLGYNRRALKLKRAAEMIMKVYGGTIPQDAEKIDALPGVGSYTAGAIAAFAFGIPSAFIETNIRTVYLHFFFKGKTKVHDDELLSVIAETLLKKRVREWYNALMDYGAMLKETVGNPNIHSSGYSKQSKFKGSRRELRGAILRHASLKGTVTPSDVTSPQSEFSAVEIIYELVSEGFLQKKGAVFFLA